MTDTAGSQEDLTSGDQFDMNEVIARAIAAEADAPVDTSLSDPEDGPDSDEESGELPAENGVDAEESKVEQAEAAPVEEPSGDTEPAKPVVESPAPPVPDPRDAEIRQLKDLVAQSQQAIRDLAVQQRAAQAPQPQMPKVSEDAVRLALFGGQEGQEAWKSLNPQDRAEAERVAREYFRREAKAAVNPAARFEEIREHVLAEVSDLVQPLVQDFYDRQAARTFEKVAGHVKDPADRQRLKELYSQHPSSRGATLDEQRIALETAAQRLDIERQKKALEEKEQRIAAKTRQDQANRNARLGGKGSSVRRSDAPTNTKQPAWDDGENMNDFVNKLLAMESAGV